MVRWACACLVCKIGIYSTLRWRGVQAKTCSVCGQLHAMPLSQRVMVCDCGNVMDRDVNAAKNLEQYGRLALLGDLKRTQELSKTSSLASALTV